MDAYQGRRWDYGPPTATAFGCGFPLCWMFAATDTAFIVRKILDGAFKG